MKNFIKVEICTSYSII